MSETKGFIGPLEVKDADQGLVEAVVATLNVVDRDGDVILPGALPAGGAKVVLSGYAHDVVRNGLAPVGKGTITELGEQLVLRGRFFLTTTHGREAFNTVKELGPDSQWSFGFPPRVKTGELTPEMKAAGAWRAIAGFSPIEASPVLVAAGVGTGTTSVKTAAVPTPRACDLALLEINARECLERSADLAAGRPPGVKEVAACYVDSDDTLCRAAEAACRDLGIPLKRIRYFRDGPPGLSGFYDPVFAPDAIWVKADRAWYRQVVTVGHELEHVRQVLHGEADDEAKARRYGEKLRRSDPRYWPSAVEAPCYDAAGMR